MYHNGYLKVALSTPKLTVGNPNQNANEIIKVLNNVDASIVLFPELILSGYTSYDLFFRSDFIKENLSSLKLILEKTTYKGIYIIGLPLEIKGVLYNVAAVCQNGEVLGVVPKNFLPNYREFGEKRWFESGLNNKDEFIDLFNKKTPFGSIIFKDSENDINFGVEVCQDMWTIKAPSDDLSLNGAHLIFNLSASTEHTGKMEMRRNTAVDASRRQNSAYIYTSGSSFESTVDVVFSTHKIVSELGVITAESTSLSNEEILYADIDIDAIKYARKIDSSFRDQIKNANHLFHVVSCSFAEDSNYSLEEGKDRNPFVPKVIQEFELIHHIQKTGLIRKLSVFKDPKVIIGVSGGIDSTLALLVARDAFLSLNLDLKNIIGINMPSKNSREITQKYANDLMDMLGVTKIIQPIDEMVELHLKELKHDDKDITYENAQARIRTLNLMNLANKYNGMVLGTGDMSEIALGWMTFNGDHMSMYNVNSGVPKTLAQALINYHRQNGFININELLENILNMPISPELLKEQVTEETIGSYEINDYIMYHFLVKGKDDKSLIWLLQQVFKLDKNTSEIYVNRFTNRFYSQQFKRQVMPEGPKVLEVSLSPRGDLRLASELKRK